MIAAPIRRGLAATVPALALTLIASAAPASASARDGASHRRTDTTTASERVAERSLLRLINVDRARHGLRPLRLQPRLSAYARRHAANQLHRRDLWHNLDAYERWVPRGATVIGENVGSSDSVPDVHRAYMRSPGHRANILDREYNYVGIGVQVTADGEMYNSVEFMGCTGRACRY